MLFAWWKRRSPNLSLERKMERKEIKYTEKKRLAGPGKTEETMGMEGLEGMGMEAEARAERAGMGVEMVGSLSDYLHLR